MFDLYLAATPNGQKVPILLEELGLPYHTHYVDIFKGEQFQAEFLKLNPLHQIPVLVNGEQVVCESGAILWYVAEQAGQLIPTAQRAQVSTWLFFETGRLGPLMRRVGLTKRGLGHVDPSVIDPERGNAEILKLFGLLEGSLKADYLVGEYSIADIALWPWVNLYGPLGLSLDPLPNLAAWHRRMRARPAVLRGLRAAQAPDSPR